MLHKYSHHPYEPYGFSDGIQQYIFYIILYLHITVLFAGNKNTTTALLSALSPVQTISKRRADSYLILTPCDLVMQYSNIDLI